MLRRLALVCALTLTACGQPAAHVAITAPSGAPQMSAWSPALGPPLAFIVATDRQSREARWYFTAVANRPVARPKVEQPQRETTPHPKPSHGGGSHRGYATAKECVSWVENGGDYGRSSNPSHFGRYQFAVSTWAAHGGNPDHWGHASADEQDAVFERTWNSPDGPANWLPYDHC